MVTPQENTWLVSNTSQQHFLWLPDVGEWIQDQLVTSCSYDTPVAELFFSVFLLSQSDTCLQVPLIKEMSDFVCSIDQSKLPAANLWTSQKCLWRGELCSVVQVIGLSGNVIGYYTVIL